MPKCTLKISTPPRYKPDRHDTMSSDGVFATTCGESERNPLLSEEGVGAGGSYCGLLGAKALNYLEDRLREDCGRSGACDMVTFLGYAATGDRVNRSGLVEEVETRRRSA